MKELKWKRAMKRKINTIVFICFFIFPVLVKAQNNQDKHRIIFYNVENLFDIEDDPEKRDNEFLPKGDRFWNERKFYTKLNRIFQVVMAASEGNQPTLIGLCEIENRGVLELLLHKTPLGTMGYKIIHQESPDRRGIDVAILYKSKLFEPISYKAHPVSNPNDESFKTRDIIHATGKINQDTIHFFVNHWPSKYGGVVETKPLRALAANVLRSTIDSLLSINPESKVIAVGDFNDSPFDESITAHLNAKETFVEADKPQIINLSYPQAILGKGTNKYQGKWELIDQVFVTTGLLTNSGLTTNFDDFKIYEADFILEEDKSYLGKKPFRTYLGFKYNNGFSDHLPVILDLHQNN